MRSCYLAASHEALEYNPEGAAAWTRTYQQSGVPFQLRTAHEFADLAFRDLEIAEPGLVMVSEWRPDNNAPGRCSRKSASTGSREKAVIPSAWPTAVVTHTAGHRASTARARRCAGSHIQIM
jgi:hypothetical protein